MINHTTPYLTPEEVMDQESITAAVAAAGHPHISVMGMHYQELLRLHTFMHLAGHEDTLSHAECMQSILRTEADLARGLKAVWS